jgi:asparagine synthase (glutamine-hydrolysing)
MCAICGVFRLDDAPIDLDRVLAMRDAMAMRGPDAAGLSHGPGFALGHRRLSIIDLSAAGNQPMSNEDGTVQVILNGEIYNFSELRPELEAAGHRFHSHTDTEVLVHGFEHWGFQGLLERIRGMYAFAILDTRAHEIHLARDPLGKKPLFFRYAGDELVFASSARALGLGLDSTPEVNPAAVHDLLWHTYIPGPRTIFRGVEKLLPGWALSLGRDGRRQDFRHWEPDFSKPEHGVSEEEWLDRVEAALTTAVRRRLVADVPVGILLSGGVDSGLVTALAARVAGRVKTFSVVHDDAAIDESRYAEAVAARYGTEHHPLLMQQDARADLPELVAAMGEPLADSSAINVFAISRLARHFITVVLAGDGGDECFGGYGIHFAHYMASRVRRFVPRPALPALALAGNIMAKAPSPLHRAGTLFKFTAQPVATSFGQMGRNLDEATRANLFTPEFRVSLADYCPTAHYDEALSRVRGGTDVDRTMQAQMRTQLPDDFLTKVDVATMGVSLEARCPFLDLDVVELAMRIPARVRFRRCEPKGLLRQLARRHMPPECVNRRKLGFQLPIRQWLREDWSDLVDDLILGPQVERRGWFQRPALKRLVEQHRQGARNDFLLWSLLVLELWLRKTCG